MPTLARESFIGLEVSIKQLITPKLWRELSGSMAQTGQEYLLCKCLPSSYIYYYVKEVNLVNLKYKNDDGNSFDYCGNPRCCNNFLLSKAQE